MPRSQRGGWLSIASQALCRRQWPCEESTPDELSHTWVNSVWSPPVPPVLRALVTGDKPHRTRSSREAKLYPHLSLTWSKRERPLDLTQGTWLAESLQKDLCPQKPQSTGQTKTLPNE